MAWKISIAAAVVVLGFFIWPTPYRYDHEYGQVVRINRFTGTVESYSNTHWTKGVYAGMRGRD